jgi:hypothetical protein
MLRHPTLGQRTPLALNDPPCRPAEKYYSKLCVEIQQLNQQMHLIS